MGARTIRVDGVHMQVDDQFVHEYPFRDSLIPAPDYQHGDIVNLPCAGGVFINVLLDMG